MSIDDTDSSDEDYDIRPEWKNLCMVKNDKTNKRFGSNTLANVRITTEIEDEPEHSRPVAIDSDGQSDKIVRLYSSFTKGLIRSRKMTVDDRLGKHVIQFDSNKKTHSSGML